MVLPSLDRLSYIHCLLKEFLPNKNYKRLFFFITSTRTLILTALGIEIIRNLQRDATSIVVAVFCGTLLQVHTLSNAPLPS